MPPETSPSLLVTASSPRSGSTLVQRYVTSATRTFVWGENGRLIHALRGAVAKWPQEPHNESEYRRVMDDPSRVERAFLPNLAPPLDHLLNVVRATVRTIYEDIPRGFEAWGWKAVRYGRAEIDFVRALFPEIRLVLLVRNPWDVARSIRRKGWIDRRGYFDSMRQLATMWTERTAEYLSFRDRDDLRTHVLQYEHLDRTIDELDRFLGVAPGGPTWSEISNRRLGASPRLTRYDLTPEDVDVIEEVAGEVAGKLGYRGPSRSPLRIGLPL